MDLRNRYGFVVHEKKKKIALGSDENWFTVEFGCVSFAMDFDFWICVDSFLILLVFAWNLDFGREFKKNDKKSDSI